MSNELRPIAIDLDSENPFEELEKMLGLDPASIAARRKNELAVHELVRGIVNYLNKNGIEAGILNGVQDLAGVCFTVGAGLALAAGVPRDEIARCTEAVFTRMPDRDYAHSFCDPLNINVDEFVQRVYGKTYEPIDESNSNAFDGT